MSWEDAALGDDDGHGRPAEDVVAGVRLDPADEVHALEDLAWRDHVRRRVSGETPGARDKIAHQRRRSCGRTTVRGRW